MRNGQTKQVWTPEQYLKILRRHLDVHISLRTLDKEYNAESGWIKAYIKDGEEHICFTNKVKSVWHAVRPVEILVSHMTICKNHGRN